MMIRGAICLLWSTTTLAFAQPEPAVAASTELSGLSPLVGVWRSRLDPKYRDHPMVKKFNPDLKAQELVIEWGPQRTFLRMSIWDIDRPNEGDRTPLVEGLVMPNVASGDLVLAEFNMASSRAYRGRWNVLPHGDVVRTFETRVANGEIARYRETWRFRDSTKDVFDWYMETYRDAEFVAGDVVVSWHKIDQAIAPSD